jgi:DNA modification methylase
VEYVHFYTKGKFKFCFKDGTVKPKVKRKSFGGKMKASTPNKNEVSYGMYQEIVEFRSPKKSERVHPTQKPKGMSEMIAKIVGEERRVLDPFCGSGSLLSAFPNGLGVDLKDWWADA